MDTVVKHSAKTAIKWASDGPLEELERAALLGDCVPTEINSPTAEEKPDPSISSFQLRGLPRRSGAEGNILCLKLQHESGGSVHVSLGERPSLTRSDVLRSFHTELCLPLTFGPRDTTLLTHGWILSNPLAISLNVCDSYTK